jgi:transcriptional regulator with XRE-family HTH domain
MTDDDRDAWAPLIAERRQQLEMTQKQLAKAAGVSPKTVYNIEAGGRTPQPQSLRKLQAALGLSTDIDVARERVEGLRETVALAEDVRVATQRVGEILRQARAIQTKSSAQDDAEMRALIGPWIDLMHRAAGDDVSAWRALVARILYSLDGETLRGILLAGPAHAEARHGSHDAAVIEPDEGDLEPIEERDSAERE